jgi:hypothetical protein
LSPFWRGRRISIYHWEEARRQGQSVTPEELCRDCPERLDGLKRQIEVLELIRPLLAGEPTAAAAEPSPTGSGSSHGPAMNLPLNKGGRGVESPLDRG